MGRRLVYFAIIAFIVFYLCIIIGKFFHKIFHTAYRRWPPDPLHCFLNRAHYKRHETSWYRADVTPHPPPQTNHKYHAASATWIVVDAAAAMVTIILLSFVLAASAVNAFSLTSSLSTYTITEVSIDDKSTHHEQYSTSIGERIKNGESILQIEDLVTPTECKYIIEEVLRQDAAPTTLEKPGLVRLPSRAAAERAAASNIPCADPLSADVDNLLHTILKRAASVMTEQIPSLSEVLFNGESVCQLLETKRLEFSSREPAINIYTPKGEFLAHKDAQAITVLIPLSCPEQFQGGGTSFWSQDSRGHRVEDPTIILKPPAGTAMLFGGCVTHAGVSVEDGVRVVFVASFSSATEGSPVIMEHRDIYGDSM